uniref:Uncharacterized protein n=1 Tax=Timema poppense TaxID=170557 RepID=A0A7R9DGS7_TIMPO|nr:unnamed protein product [Timema poppensis]
MKVLNDMLGFDSILWGLLRSSTLKNICDLVVRYRCFLFTKEQSEPKTDLTAACSRRCKMKSTRRPRSVLLEGVTLVIDWTANDEKIRVRFPVWSIEAGFSLDCFPLSFHASMGTFLAAHRPGRPTDYNHFSRLRPANFQETKIRRVPGMTIVNVDIASHPGIPKTPTPREAGKPSKSGRT